jgi:hypothetical protein
MKECSLIKKPKRSEMSDEERVRDFQRKLYLKAKQEVNGEVNSIAVEHSRISLLNID